MFTAGVGNHVHRSLAGVINRPAQGGDSQARFSFLYHRLDD